MKRVGVIGAGGHGKVAVTTLRAAGYDVIAVFDDDQTRHGSSLLGCPIEGDIVAARQSGLELVVAIGLNRVRHRIVQALGESVEYATALHPTAYVAPGAEIGPGAVVFAGAIVQPGSRIGAHTIINTAATVDHDCEIGAFVHIAPGANLAGDITVGEGAMVGIGAAVISGVNIGDHALLAAGSVAVRDVPAGVTAAGVPALNIRGT